MTERARQLARVEVMRLRATELERLAGQTSEGMVPEHGQPILVGHHSERGHRRMLDRAHRVWDRQAEQAQEALKLRHRADGLDATIARTIFDDDPDVVERLEARAAFHDQEAEMLKTADLPPLLRKDAIAGARRKARAVRKRLAKVSS